MSSGRFEGWSASQRSVLIGLLLVLILFYGIRYYRNSVYVPDPQPPRPFRADEVADRIDPNTADRQTLAALPIIGEKRASDIIAYREQFQKDHPGDIPFKQIEDLENIKGIGIATVETLQPYLLFPKVSTTKPN
jgi:competence ComEA-like helix-hairpin-helix protein